MLEIDLLLDKIKLNDISDIHIDSDCSLKVRKDGLLCENSPEIISCETVKKYIKELLSNDEKYEEFLENGQIDFKYNRNEEYNFRVNAFKSRNGYSICMRVIKSKIPKLSNLSDSKILQSFTELKDGLVLVTGPTGSGKSTTLAAMINEINSKTQKHIITLEDPIEYIHHNKKCVINQREIGEDTKSYAMGLKAALRQDPDVILVGEMRDAETIEIALRAAQTGHLVFSTLHNMGAVNSLYRIINSFNLSAQSEIKVQLSSLLKGVVSQVLLPRNGGEGRVCAMEIMVCTTGIKNLIREGDFEQINSFIQMGSSHGMQTMESDIKKLVSNDTIEYKEYEAWLKNNN